jgi:acetyl esterase/lipase
VAPLSSAEDLERAAGRYLGGADPRNPLASPVFADLHGLPPLLVQAGDHELLLSDSTRLARQAQAARVEVTLEIWDEMWHVWHGWAGELPEGRQAIEGIGAFIRRKLGLV